MAVRALNRFAVVALVRRRTAALCASSDRGDVVGWVIVIPLLMVLTIGGVQIAMLFHARNICQAATQSGIRAGRVLNAPDNAATAAATGFLNTVGDGAVADPNITQVESPTTITVICTGQAQRVIPIPGLSISVTQSSTAQRERFTTP